MKKLKKGSASRLRAKFVNKVVKVTSIDGKHHVSIGSCTASKENAIKIEGIWVPTSNRRISCITEK